MIVYNAQQHQAAADYFSQSIKWLQEKLNGCHEETARDKIFRDLTVTYIQLTDCYAVLSREHCVYEAMKAALASFECIAQKNKEELLAATSFRSFHYHFEKSASSQIFLNKGRFKNWQLLLEQAQIIPQQINSEEIPDLSQLNLTNTEREQMIFDLSSLHAALPIIRKKTTLFQPVTVIRRMMNMQH